jgi:hypothetical protein
MGVTLLICPITTCADLAAALASIRAHNRAAAQYVGPRPVAELDPAMLAVHDALAASGGSLGPCWARDKYTRGEDVLGGGYLVHAGCLLLARAAAPIRWIGCRRTRLVRAGPGPRRHLALLALPAVAKCARQGWLRTWPRRRGHGPGSQAVLGFWPAAPLVEVYIGTRKRSRATAPPR